MKATEPLLDLVGVPTRLLTLADVVGTEGDDGDVAVLGEGRNETGPQREKRKKGRTFNV